MDSRNGKRGKLQTLLMAAAIAGLSSAAVFVMPAPSWAAKIDGKACQAGAPVYRHTDPTGRTYYVCHGANGLPVSGGTCEGAAGECPAKKTLPPKAKGLPEREYDQRSR